MYIKKLLFVVTVLIVATSIVHSNTIVGQKTDSNDSDSIEESIKTEYTEEEIAEIRKKYGMPETKNDKTAALLHGDFGYSGNPFLFFLKVLLIVIAIILFFRFIHRRGFLKKN